MYLKSAERTNEEHMNQIVRSMIFSQGSNIDSTKVDSNHMRQRQKNRATFDLGGLVKVRSGLGGRSLAFVGVSMLSRCLSMLVNASWQGTEYEWVTPL